MKIILAMFLAASLVAAPYAVAANAMNPSSGLPPIEQPLVREGEFAVELATALNLTSSHDEAAAENYLISMDIAPRNGWISDYPMTPDIIAEIQQSVARSASSGKLHISQTDAANIVNSVSIAMNLPVKMTGERYTYDSSSEYTSDSAGPPPEASDYVEPSSVEDYYNDNEPPVVTYYPPPWDYAYLYDWVPDQFWWDGFGFGGYFILGDFDRDHHHHITNHVTHSNGTVSRIDATTRAGARPNTTNTANASPSRNSTSSGAARDSDISARDPGRASRDMDRVTSSPRVSQDTASGASSYSGRTFNSAPPAHFSNGGGMGGFHGSGGFGGGGFGGGFHGGGGFGGGGHGGGGGHR